MSSRFGNDVILNDGDIVTGPGGDLFTADDYERLNPNDIMFEGQFAITYSITNKLLTLKGDNVFHPDYGSELSELVSTPNSTALKTQVKNAVAQALQEDDRIQSVRNITVEQRDRFVNVKAEVVLIGSDEASELVFPNFFIE